MEWLTTKINGMHFNLIFLWVSKGICKLFAQTMDDREHAMADETPTMDGNCANSGGKKSE